MYDDDDDDDDDDVNDHKEPGTTYILYSTLYRV